MKKLMKTVAVLLLMGSSVAFANDHEEQTTFEMSMYFDQSSEKLKTFYEKKKGSVLRVEILNSKGQKLTETVIGKKSTNSQLNFDMKGLQDGAYTLIVSDEKGSVEKTINIATTEPERVVSL